MNIVKNIRYKGMKLEIDIKSTSLLSTQQILTINLNIPLVNYEINLKCNICIT